MRFELIDHVLERTSRRIIALKSVTTAEEYLADHFPRFPVLPGVLMLEAMVQSARRLLHESVEGSDASASGGRWVLAEAKNIRYGNMVRPGEQLRVSVEMMKCEGDRYSFKGEGKVEEAMAVQGRFVLRPLNVGSSIPASMPSVADATEHG